MNPEELKEMNEIKWWHQIELDGAITRGIDFSKDKLRLIQMPEDLKGKSVIDIGAWDGFFSFEAERRGAKVLAVDTVMWDPKHPQNTMKEHWNTGKKGFEFAKKILKSKVEDKEVEVPDLSKETVGEFDLTLCLGILYHMEDPLGTCRKMFEITKEGGMLILETHIDALNETKPGMIFYGETLLNEDPGNWWGPNIKCVQEMLKIAGFKKVDLLGLNYQRGIFHAYKFK